MSAGVYTSDTHDKSSRLKCEAVVSLCNLGACCFWMLLTVFLLRLWLMGLHFQGFRWRKPVISRSCCQSQVLLRCFALTCLLGGGGVGGAHPECWRLFGTKVSESDWYVNCFCGKKLSQHLLYHLLSWAPPFLPVVERGESADPATPLGVILLCRINK